MGWECTVDETTLAGDDLNAGEWEQLYILVNQVGLPHDEMDIRPSHCPTCRNLIVAATLARAHSLTLELACEQVSMMSRDEVLDTFLPRTVDAKVI